MPGALGGGGSNNIGINITATNNASGVIGQVSSDLGGLQQMAGMGGGGGMLGGMGGMLGAGAIAGGAVWMAGAAADAGELGASVEALEFSFNRLAESKGLNPNEILAALRATSSGTISEYDLMLGANKALRFGVADNVDELVSILTFAKGAAREFGSDTTSAFDDLVTGIGRSSALILDNVGISLPQINQSYEDFASTVGKTVDELDDLEKKQALVNAVTQAGAQYDLTGSWSLDQYEANRAAMGDLMAEGGQLINTVVGPIAGAAATGLRQINDEIDFLSRPTVELEQNLLNVNAALTANQETFGQSQSLLQSGAGAGNAEVMANYIESLKQMNTLERERVDLQRALAGLEKPEWTPVMNPSAAAENRRQKDAWLQSSQDMENTPGSYAWQAQQQQAETAGADSGRSFIDAFSAEVSGAGDLGAAGAAAGAAWGSGFLSGALGAASGVVGAMANAVTPIVQDKLRQQASRQGAYE
jgi:hypothetical protein